MIRRSFLKMIGLAASAVMLGIKAVKRKWITIYPGDDLQAAIDEVGDGGTVYLAGGTYPVTGTIMGRPRLTITSLGHSKITNAARISHQP